jgi:hypothetical protein
MLKRKSPTHEIKVTIVIMSMANHFSYLYVLEYIQGGSNMTGTNCDLFTHNQSRSYLNYLVYVYIYVCVCIYVYIYIYIYTYIYS